jgi:hypothetical protein
MIRCACTSTISFDELVQLLITTSVEYLHHTCVVFSQRRELVNDVCVLFASIHIHVRSRSPLTSPAPRIDARQLPSASLCGP